VHAEVCAERTLGEWERRVYFFAAACFAGAFSFMRHVKLKY
jgi:hypothetical protein